MDAFRLSISTGMACLSLFENAVQTTQLEDMQTLKNSDLPCRFDNADTVAIIAIAVSIGELR